MKRLILTALLAACCVTSGCGQTRGHDTIEIRSGDERQSKASHESAPSYKPADAKVIRQYYLQGVLDGCNTATYALKDNNRLSKDEAATIRKEILEKLSKLAEENNKP